MPRADFAGVLLVVIEVGRGQHAVLVAEQPVRRDLSRIELDLNLHVLGDGHEVAAHLLDEDLASLADAVDIGIDAVAVVGQLLQLAVLQVALAEAQDGEERAAGRLLLDQLDEGVVAGHADVQVAVGRQDHAVGAVLQEVLPRLFIGELNSRAAVGRAAGGERIDRRHDLLFLVAARRRQPEAGLARIGHDRHAVVLGQLGDEHQQRRS